MLKRVMVAVVGIPFLLLVLYWAPAWATMVLLAAMCAIGAHELMHAAAGERGKPLIPMTVIMAALVPVDIYLSLAATGQPDTVMELFDAMSGSGFTGSFLAPLALVFVFFMFLLAILFYGRENAISFQGIATAIFAGLVFPLMLSCLLRLRLAGEIGKILVFVPLCISFGSDTFALFAGMLFGKHKLAPHVSPKKTVEGAIGGLVGGVLGMALILWLGTLAMGEPFCNWGDVLIFGVVGSIISQIGDLSFSVIKREYGVKDYGKLLPGHGGVLDRFDSVTFVAPFVWLLLYALGLR